MVPVRTGGDRRGVIIRSSEKGRRRGEMIKRLEIREGSLIERREGGRD